VESAKKPRKRKSKLAKKTPAPAEAEPTAGKDKEKAGGPTKITQFIVRNHAAAGATVSDSETADTRREKPKRYIRSPKTPPEKQHDDIKRLKKKPGDDDNSKDSTNG
jgi:hypothetical protein